MRIHTHTHTYFHAEAYLGFLTIFGHTSIQVLDPMQLLDLCHLCDKQCTHVWNDRYGRHMVVAEQTGMMRGRKGARDSWALEFPI